METVTVRLLKGYTETKSWNLCGEEFISTCRNDVYDEQYFNGVCCYLQLDSSLQGMLNENSFDLTSKFADLIAASAVSNDSSSLSASTAVELRTQSAQATVDVVQQ